jgi:hypothetical protein
MSSSWKIDREEILPTAKSRMKRTPVVMATGPRPDSCFFGGRRPPVQPASEMKLKSPATP